MGRGNELNKDVVKKAAEKFHDSVVPPFGTMIHLGGFEAVYALLSTYGGGEIYIPSMRKVFGHCLEKDLLEKFDGTNALQLAREYGFSERHVKLLVKREKT